MSCQMPLPRWLCGLATSVFFLGLACGDSNSKNWFGNNDRRVEPQTVNTDTRPRTGDRDRPANPPPETTQNAWNDSPAPSPSRGDPAAIEQYASRVNPSAERGPRATPVAPPAEASSPPRVSAGPTAMNEIGEPSPSPSPVRTARTESTDPWASQSSMPGARANEVRPAEPARPAADTSPRSALGTTAQPAPAYTAADTQDNSDNQMAAAPANASGAPRLSAVTAQPARTAEAPRSETHRGTVAPENRTALVANQPDAAPANIEDPAVVQRQRDLSAQEARVAADPSNIEAQFTLRTMYLFDGRDAEALAPIRGVSADAEEIMLGQLRSMQATRSGTGRDPATWANRQLEALSQLQEKLRAKADLQVPKVVLCTEIMRFGVYTPFESNDFAAGAPHDVLIYVEVDNFESLPTSGGEYRTRLAARLSLLSTAGDELVSLDEPNIEDFSRGVRRDFFLAFGPITIPATLPAGDYVVKVEIEDLNAGKINSNKTRLRLVP